MKSQDKKHGLSKIDIKVPQKKRRHRQRVAGDFLGPQDWVAAARDVLISRGVEKISIEKIATNLKVTRGSFYWHFSGRDDLLAALLVDWEAANTQPFLEIAQKFKGCGEEALNALFEVWIAENNYDPNYDSAIRDWARTNADVAAVVRKTDRKRINILMHFFQELGFPRQKAFIRARIAYFAQVGYYILGLNETTKMRSKLKKLYFEAYTAKEE